MKHKQKKRALVSAFQFWNIAPSSTFHRHSRFSQFSLIPRYKKPLLYNLRGYGDGRILRPKESDKGHLKNVFGSILKESQVLPQEKKKYMPKRNIIEKRKKYHQDLSQIEFERNESTLNPETKIQRYELAKVLTGEDHRHSWVLVPGTFNKGNMTQIQTCPLCGKRRQITIREEEVEEE